LGSNPNALTKFPSHHDVPGRNLRAAEALLFRRLALL
jgi:hypothetical protein